MIDKMKKDTQQTQSNKLFSDERIDPLLSQVQSKDAESLLGESGLAGQLKKQLAERMLEAELSHHLKQQSAKGKPTITATAAARRPSSRLRVIDRWIFRETGFPRLSLRSLPKINGACLALRIMIRMDARGMSVREIRGHLLELYGLEVSPDLISTLTDEVLAEVEQWQTRPLEAMSPI